MERADKEMPPKCKMTVGKWAI